MKSDIQGAPISSRSNSGVDTITDNDKTQVTEPEHTPAPSEDKEDTQAPAEDNKGEAEETPEEDAAAEEERLARLDMETDDDKAARPLDAGTWGQTENEHVNTALTTLQNVGISIEMAQELLAEAAIARDPSLVDQNALKSAIGPRRAKEIMTLLNAFSTDARRRDEIVTNDIYMDVNGRGPYRRLLEAGFEKFGMEGMQKYATAIDKGGYTARRAVAELTRQLEGVQDQAGARMTFPEEADTPIKVDRTKIGIDRATYIREMEALQSPKAFLSHEKTQKREAELRELRALGIKNGL